MSKMQHRVLLLAVAMIGAGAGWLGGRLSSDRQPTAALPAHNEGEVDRLAREIAALRKDLSEQRKTAPTRAEDAGSAGPDRSAVLYQGKPASHWLVQLRDRDSTFRIKAVPPLAAIARTDRSLVPLLLARLQDDSREVCQVIAREIPSLKLPTHEAGLALLRSHLSLEDLFEVLRDGDYMQALSAVAEKALHDRESRVRRKAAFLLYYFNRPREQSAIPALREAVRINRESVPACFDPSRKSDEPPLGTVSERKAALAILARMGPAAREAIPDMVAAVKESNLWQGDSTMLAQVDPEGSIAIPALLKALQETKTKDFSGRANISEALGAFGGKARAAVPLLIGTLEDLKAERKQARPEKGTNSAPDPEFLAAFEQTIFQALKQVDPEAAQKVKTGKGATVAPNRLPPGPFGLTGEPLPGPGEMAPPTKILPESPRSDQGRGEER